ncbi:trans-sialidase, putative, partial [Trypanosoma cruzi]
TAQLQRVKEVLSTWKKMDETVSKLCPSSAEEDTSTGTPCSPTVKITDGLVGFLSGNFSDGTWRDEYLGVNATVKNNEVGGNKATMHEGGVTFTGAWAEWPVGSQGENQLYHFANYNFTLVATVSIHGEPTSGSVPLIGVSAGSDGVDKLMELSYETGRSGRRCAVMEQPRSTAALGRQRKRTKWPLCYGTATMGSVYVDGKRVCVSVQ